MKERNNGIRENQLEDLISKSIKEKMKSIEKDVKIDESWETFLKRAKEQEKRRRFLPNRRMYKLVLTACLIFLIIAIYKIDTVVAFKNDIFQYILVNEEGDRILSEGSNINVDNGVYNDLSFKEAQNLTVFHLKNLQYLPEGIEKEPIITVNVIAYPISQATITFQDHMQEGKFIIFEQENMDISASRNTYLPENIIVEKQVVGNKEVTFIYGDSSINITWLDNSIRHTLITHAIPKNDIIKIINNIK